MKITPDIISCGYYKIHVHGGDNAPCIDIARLAELLPHGSGIDGDWHLTIRRHGDVQIVAEIHCMDEWGGYDGWTTWRATIRRAKVDELHDLCGCMLGYRQVVRRAGDIYLSNSTDARGYGDWVHETVSSILHDAGILSPSPRDSSGNYGLCIDTAGNEFQRKPLKG